jgi:hypothetical protein
VIFDEATGMTGAEAARLLWERDPRISVAVDGDEAISFTPELLQAGEEDVLLERVAGLVGEKVRV